MLAVITAGLAPGLALLSYFYLKDKYEAEPIVMVFRIFVFGALLVFPIMFIQYVLGVEEVFSHTLLQAFLSVGLLEEFFKWFILFYTVYQHIEFDEQYDGIVYGASLSLGFATLENILYLFANGVQFAVGRALLPVSSHALFGVIMGFYLGKAKFSTKEEKKWIFISFLFPFLLHGFYDYILLSMKKWIFIMVPFMLFLWWFGLHKVKIAKP
ncbi:glutamic-type intramembrane protease PrsW [Bacillus sp. JJ1521]|uniref:glutamic-type intramembrane protease PrsW n=1 Tax=Bacillus sp. JJ1521 TaxID=3122957 RepID=UPI002FFD8B8E